MKLSNWKFAPVLVALVLALAGAAYGQREGPDMKIAWAEEGNTWVI